MVQSTYARGFLYHPPTQQFLLTQSSPESVWTMIGDIYLPKETAEKAFQRIAKSMLKIQLALSAIYPVYSYLREDLKRQHSIIYAEIGDIKNVRSGKTALYGWFTKKQLVKLPLDPQTKQDIIVGQRVIDAKVREVLGQHTL